MTNLQAAMHVCAGAMVIAGIFLVGRIRLRSMLLWYAVQTLALALLAVLAGVQEASIHLLVSALLTVALKVVLLPWVLVRVERRTGRPAMRLDTPLRVAPLTVLAVALAAAASVVTAHLLPDLATHDRALVAAAAALIVLGFQLLITHADIPAQIIAFLQMENGVFAFGLALAAGMPFMVELGVFFDVTVGVLLMAALSFRVTALHRAPSTKHLRELVD